MEAALAVKRLQWRGRFAALAEVVGVFVVGTLVARLVSRALALGPASLRALEPGITPDFVALSASAAANLVVRYGFVLGLAFAVGWWHRKRPVSAYGLTAAGRRFGYHALVGILLFAVASLLPLIVRILPSVIPMGRGPSHWELIQDLRSPGIWLYLFVGSFGLVPIAEELLARGYIQTRLMEDFGTGAAILITAVFFTFSHTQYFILSGTGIGMLLSLFVGSLALGYARYRTSSVFPGIIAHALGNLPFRGWLLPMLLALMVLVVAICARTYAAWTTQLWNAVMSRDALLSALAGVVVLAIVLAFIFAAPALLPLVASAALLAALMLELREKRER